MRRRTQVIPCTSSLICHYFGSLTTRLSIDADVLMRHLQLFATRLPESFRTRA